MRDEFTVHTLPKWARYNTIVSMISLYFIVMTSLGTSPTYSLPIVLMFCGMFVATLWLGYSVRRKEERKEEYELA